MSISESLPHEITLEQVLELIRQTERRHRVVWTAGRVLKEEGSLHQVMTGDPIARKRLLKRVRAILKALVHDGSLAERGPQFNYGTTTEVSYDFCGSLVAEREQLG